jgi:hypothetical protein
VTAADPGPPPCACGWERQPRPAPPAGGYDHRHQAERERLLAMPAANPNIPDGSDLGALDLSTRPLNCLIRDGYTMITEVGEASDEDLLGIRNFGAGSLAEVRAAIARTRTLNLYIWKGDGVLEDWYSGMIVAVAADLDAAKIAVRDAYDEDGSGCPARYNLEASLAQPPEVTELSAGTEPRAWYVEGHG